MFTLNYLRSILSYNPDTGFFVWRKALGPRSKVGKPAGSSDKDGYDIIQIQGRKYKAHRLAWLYMTGEWPASEIDHRDGCPSNNVWFNLREATRTGNVCNSDRELGQSGLRGVKFNPRTSSWIARIAHGCYRTHLGSFGTAEEAYAAYLAAAENFHGEFALQKRNPSIKGPE